MGVQGADAVGQLHRQHGHHLVGKIHRGTPLPGLQVQRGAGAYIVAHIGDVDPQHPAALVVLLQTDRVVKVLGGGPVDGDDGLAPQVQPPRQGGGLHRLGDGLSLCQHGRREGAHNVMGVENGLHGTLPPVGGAKPLPQGAHGGGLAAAETGHGHSRPLAGAHPLPLGEYLDGAGQAVVVRFQPEGVVLPLQHAGDGFVGPLQHLDHLGHPSARLWVLLGDAGRYFISIPGAAVGPGWNEAVLPLLGDQKAEAPAAGLVDTGQFLCLFHRSFLSDSGVSGLYYTPFCPRRNKKRPSETGRAFFRILRSGR